jgi:hypothetical protein
LVIGESERLRIAVDPTDSDGGIGGVAFSRITSHPATVTVVLGLEPRQGVRA